MASGKTVMVSIEAPGGMVCVDLFRRDDGSWGFEEYRRDPEDSLGWYPIGQFSNQSFESEADARRAAGGAIAWLPHSDP